MKEKAIIKYDKYHDEMVIFWLEIIASRGCISCTTAYKETYGYSNGEWTTISGECDYDYYLSLQQATGEQIEEAKRIAKDLHLSEIEVRKKITQKDKDYMWCW